MEESKKVLHNRHSFRLKEHDYSDVGSYFITICTYEYKCLFGEIINGEMQLNPFGNIVLLTWNDLINHIASIELGEFVIMPNHVHGIVNIVDPEKITYEKAAGNLPGLKIAKTQPPQKPLSEIVRQFKTFSATRINNVRKMRGSLVWKRNYFERIIRNEKAYMAVEEYIHNNPFQWELDKYNDANYCN